MGLTEERHRQEKFNKAYRGIHVKLLLLVLLELSAF